MPVSSTWLYRKRELSRLLKVHLSSGLEAAQHANNEYTITVSRIIGNDLYPRHEDGQTEKNLNFILDNEPNFPNCRKVFVINRIFDKQKQASLEALVAKHGHTSIVIPFVEEDYVKFQFDNNLISKPPYEIEETEIPEYTGLTVQRNLLACADKIRYAINVNGARNRALEDGRKNGLWTVLLDGSCYLSEAAFSQIKVDFSRKPATPYVVIPMTRLQSYEAALTQTPIPTATEEPQIAFHENSLEFFDERFPYGFRDKTSLLDRLGIPGDWSHWNKWESLNEEQAKCPERHHYKFTNTCVFRLPSDAQGGHLESRTAQNERYRSRNKAIFHSLAMLDRRALYSNTSELEMLKSNS